MALSEPDCSPKRRQGTPEERAAAERAGFGGLLEYARSPAKQGLQTKLLAGLPHNFPATQTSRWKDAQELAQRRLRAFAFIGIQEAWELSLCVAHLTFGGKLLESEVGNTRPSAHSFNGSAEEKVRMLHAAGVLAPADAAIYKLGRSLLLRRAETQPYGFSCGVQGFPPALSAVCSKKDGTRDHDPIQPTHTTMTQDPWYFTGEVGGKERRLEVRRGELYTWPSVWTPHHLGVVEPLHHALHQPRSLRGGLLPVALGGRLRANVTQQRLGLVALLP